MNNGDNKKLNYFFFTDPCVSKSFWDRDFHRLLKNRKNFEIENEDCIFLLKQSRYLKSWVPRFYTVQGHYLIYGEKEPKGFVNLITTYMQVFTDSKPHKYRIQLIHDNQEINLYTKSEQDFNKIVQNMQQSCILLTFHDHYDIVKQIGKGSSSSVYIAQSRSDLQHYAIKRVLKLYNGKQKEVVQQSIVNEIIIMRELSHPNILQIYQVFETNRHINIVLELIQGGELLKDVKYQNMKDARQVARSLLLCIDYMHQKGIMHRDLKPQNILCKPNSLDVVIADFGLATYIKHAKPLFARCGTTGYVAPEVIDYKEGYKLYNEKCDIFSLGVIFYQLFFHKHPFKDTTKAGIMKKNHTVDFKFEDTTKVPQSAKELITLMLKYNPKHRPTAAELLRHDFFCEVIKDHSFQQVSSSNQDSDARKSQNISFSSQVNDLRLSSFQKYQKYPDVNSSIPVERSQELKEMSGIWCRRISIKTVSPQLQLQKQNQLQQQQQQQLNTQQLNQLNSSFQGSQGGEIRKKNGSIFKQEFNQNIQMSRQVLINQLQFDYGHQVPPVLKSNNLFNSFNLL